MSEQPNEESLKEIEARFLRYINKTDDLLSLLYDMDLMPEQLERGTFKWRQMLILTAWHVDRFKEHKANFEETMKGIVAFDEQRAKSMAKWDKAVEDAEGKK